MSHLHWAAITEGLLESVWVVDPETLRIVAVNEAALRLVGAQRDEMVGSPVHQWASDLQDHVYWDEWCRGVQQTLESEAMLVRRAARCCACSAASARCAPPTGQPSCWWRCRI